MLRRLLLMGVLAGAAMAAVASPLNYAFRAVPIRAAVVLLDSQQTAGTQSNDAPHVFYNLDSNRNIKPGGWTFYNPSAPSRVTAAIQARWQALSGVAMPIDETITKRSAPYWELRLSQAGEAQIAKYDLLLVPCYRFVALNANEREKLRRFVEGGGVLWVDTAFEGAFAPPLTLDAINGFPLPFVVSTTNVGLAESFDFTHPIFNRPNTISSADLFNMESEKHHGLRNVDLAAMGFGDLQLSQTTTEYDSTLFQPVAEDDLGTKIAVAQIGQGYMVVTARGLSRTINQVVDPVSGTFTVNRSAYAAKPAFSRNADAAAKLVINMTFLASGYGQIGRGSRKTNASILDLGAPMLRSWDARYNLSPGSFNYIPPAVHKGRVYSVSDNTLYCFDARPSNDLDDDGNPDDGDVDYSFGANRDKVWEAPIAGPCSPPTTAEVPGSVALDQVAIVDNNGRLVVFNAVTGAQIANIAPPSNAEVETGLPGRGPYAPTFHDGFYFVADQVNLGLSSVGRVWMADGVTLALATSAGPWQCGGAGSPIFTKPCASPTVGYIPINDGSGGLDRVVYFPTRPTSGGGPNGNAGINSLWLGVKGEKPFSWAVSGGQLFVVTRANLQGLSIYRPTNPSPLGIKLTILDNNGNPIDATQMDTLFTSAVTETAGLLAFTFETGQTLPSNYAVRIDYSIDWGRGTPGLGAQILRGQLFLPDNTARRRRILGNLALSPDGTLHAVHSDPDISNPSLNTGGAYYAFKEEKRGEFKMRSRFELYRDHTFSLNQAGVVNYRETLMDVDPLQAMAPGNVLAGAFRNQRFIGGPTVHNDICYVPAGATKGFGIPITLVMAFRADPSIPEVVVGDIQGAFTVIQPDLARSDNKQTPTQQSVFGNGNYVYERDSGSSRGVIRFDNLMNVPRGFIGNSMNLSQPIIIRRNGQPDLLIEPNATGDRWNPLLWFMALHGMDGDDGAGPVLVTGDTLFVAGKSAVYSLMTTGGLQNRGMLTAITSTVAPNDPFLRSDTLRPWIKQFITMETSPSFRINPGVRWPQYVGITSFNDWLVRLGQTVMNPSTSAFGVVGGENVLTAWTELGLWTFSKSDYLVCDEGRLARFDGSGNPIWTADAAIKSSLETNIGSSGETKPLVRPTKAYVLNDREMLVCDTGSNRIVRLDISGREIRSIDGFNLDPGYVPEGYSPGASTRLREPRDVLVFTTYENNPGLVSNPQPRERWTHYLIADSGNKRLIELIDRHRINPATGRLEGVITNADGTPATGILWWHTPASVSGKDFDYNSLARVFVENIAAPGTGSWVYAAGIGSAMPTRVDLGLDVPTTTVPRESPGGNGGIVVFNGSTTIVINQVTVPDVAANVYYNVGTGTFNSAMQPSRLKRLGNLQSVTMRNIVDPILGNRVAIMFADAEGVFEIVQPAANGPWVVRWMMTREAYRFARRTGTTVSWSNALDLRATYARRLDSGDVLIVNGYAGQTLGPNPNTPGVKSEFTGEVLTVDGDQDPTNNNSISGFSFSKENLGFSNLSIKAELPPVQGARGIVVPVFADRR